MRAGEIQDLILVARDAEPVGRSPADGVVQEGWYVDLVHTGDSLPAVVVYGTTAFEAQRRARELLEGLRLRRRGA